MGPVQPQEQVRKPVRIAKVLGKLELRKDFSLCNKPALGVADKVESSLTHAALVVALVVRKNAKHYQSRCLQA
jgi:hypothetical protein